MLSVRDNKAGVGGRYTAVKRGWGDGTMVLTGLKSVLFASSTPQAHCQGHVHPGCLTKLDFKILASPHTQHSLTQTSNLNWFPYDGNRMPSPLQNHWGSFLIIAFPNLR